MNAARATSWHIELPHAPAAAPIARAVVRNALAELESAVDRETAELLVCEMVTNAVEHTADDAAVSLSVTERGAGLLVEVRDRDPHPLAGLPTEGEPRPVEELARETDPEHAPARAEPAPTWPEHAPTPGEHAPAPGEYAPEPSDHTPAPGEYARTDDATSESPETLDTLSLEDLAEDGRGLLLIRSLSTTSGSRATREGKTVWFTLQPEEPQPDEQPTTQQRTPQDQQTRDQQPQEQPTQDQQHPPYPEG